MRNKVLLFPLALAILLAVTFRTPPGQEVPPLPSPRRPGGPASRRAARPGGAGDNALRPRPTPGGPRDRGLYRHLVH